MSFVRAASKVSRVGVRVPAARVGPIAWSAQRAFSVSPARYSDQHAEETFEEFTARYDALLPRAFDDIEGWEQAEVEVAIELH